MPWIFSKAMAIQCENCTSLQALEAEFSQATFSETDASAPLSGSHTPKPSLWHDKTMEASRLSRFGMTCGLFEGSRGEGLLTWWLEDFLAKTSAQPEKEPASPESAAVCGHTWLGLLARYDQSTSLWKTAQHSLLGDSTAFLETWPRSGSMLNGECWERPMLVPRTKGSGFGLWRTPGAYVTEEKTTVVKLDGRKPSDPQVDLADQVMAVERKLWPTPTVCGNNNRKGLSANSGDGLATAAKTWPTPQASDSRDRGNASTAVIARRIAKGKQVMLSMSVSTESGRLNPDWVELLMGWPLGWTSLSELSPSEFARWRDGGSQSECGHRYGASAWADGSWETGIHRVVNGGAHRSHRLKAIGNGQVPAAAVAAWGLLSHRSNTNKR